MKQKLFSCITVASILFIFCACGDEIENIIEVEAETVFDTLATRSSARIVSYKVENAPTDIVSAINDSTGQITVYLPHYYTLGFIDPEITLPEGASISPDADELVPVFGEEPVVYTVSAPGEEDATYTVVPIVQQPDLILDELSSEQDTIMIAVSSSIFIRGKNFIPHVSEGYLIDENENEWSLLSGSIGDIQSQNSTSMIFRSLGVTYEGNIEPFLNGPFWIEMRAYALTARMKYPIRFMDL